MPVTGAVGIRFSHACLPLRERARPGTGIGAGLALILRESRKESARFISRPV